MKGLESELVIREVGVKRKNLLAKKKGSITYRSFPIYQLLPINSVLSVLKSGVVENTTPPGLTVHLNLRESVMGFEFNSIK